MELIQLIPMILFTALGWISKNPVLFMLAGACAFFNGLNWYDAYGTHEALAISLMLIVACFVLWGFAFKYIFWREQE